MQEQNRARCPVSCLIFFPKKSSKIPPQNESLNSAKFAGGYPNGNTFGTVVYATERSNIDTVMIGGRNAKQNGKVVGVDTVRLHAAIVVFHPLDISYWF